MIRQVLNRRSTALHNAARRWVSWGAALLFIFWGNTYSAAYNLPQPPALGGAKFIQLTCKPIPAPQLLLPPDGSEVHFTWQDPYYFLTWQDVPGIEEYWLRIWDTDTGDLVLDGSSGTSNGEGGVVYEVVDLSGDLAWQVTAVNPTPGCPNSPPSETWHILAVRNPPPAVPINLTASDGTYTDRVVLTWEQPVSASILESWQIWRSTQPDLQSAKELAAEYSDYVPNKSYEDQAVTSGTIYYYWVEACSHSDGCSEKSIPDSGFTQEALPVFEYSIHFPIVLR